MNYAKDLSHIGYRRNTGFRHCKFCQGKGCVACPGERKRYEAQQTAAMKEWQPPSDESVSTAKGILKQLDENYATMPDEELDAALRLPKPIMTISLTDERELAFAKELIGGEVLQKLGEESAGDPMAFRDALMQQAEQYRIKQGELHDKERGE